MNQSISLDHLALRGKDKKKIRTFFEQLLQCQFVKSFFLSEELTKKIFQIGEAVEVVVYEGFNYRFEVFITDTSQLNSYAHICLSVNDREKFLERCDHLEVNYFKVRKNGKTLVFIKDHVGNLFEIKSQ